MLFVRPHPSCAMATFNSYVCSFFHACIHFPTHLFTPSLGLSAPRLPPCSQAGCWFLGARFKEQQQHLVAWPHVLELHEKPLEPFHRNSDEIMENPGALLHTKPRSFFSQFALWLLRRFGDPTVPSAGGTHIPCQRGAQHLAQRLGGAATPPPTLFKAGLERAQDTTSRGHQAGWLEQSPALFAGKALLCAAPFCRATGARAPGHGIYL